MPTYRITAPDGKTYRVTGEGSADDALKHIQSLHGTPPLTSGSQPAPLTSGAPPEPLTADPSEGMSFGEKFLVGAGAATDRAIRGVTGLFGKDNTQGAEDAALYQKYHPGTAASLGEIGADIAMTAMPAGAIMKGSQGLRMLPRVAANMGGNAAMSAAIAPEDRGAAALTGGLGAGAGMVLGALGNRVLPLATKAGRAALLERKAGGVLASDLGELQGQTWLRKGTRPDAAAAADQMEQYLAGRSGIAKDVPLTTAQTMRQAEGATAQPGSAALSKRQLGVAGAAADEFATLARNQNAALHEAATSRAGADSGRLQALTDAREAASSRIRCDCRPCSNTGQDTSASRQRRFTPWPQSPHAQSSSCDSMRQ